MAVQSSHSNILLRTLTVEDATLLEPHLERVVLPLRHPLERPGTAIEHVYFLETGVASIVASAGRHKRTEVGLFGREGMSGTALVLGNETSPNECFMQLAGNGMRIDAASLCVAMDASVTLRGKFLRFANSLSVQTAQTAVANAQAHLEERLCRWLLMCHDRTVGDVLSLTHDFLSTMLGVRRAGVTLAVHLLEGRGLIRAKRGRIQVIDRDGLEDCADAIYGIPEAEYERLIGVGRSEWTGAPAGRPDDDASERPTPMRRELRTVSRS